MPANRLMTRTRAIQVRANLAGNLTDLVIAHFSRFDAAADLEGPAMNWFFNACERAARINLLAGMLGDLLQPESLSS